MGFDSPIDANDFIYSRWCDFESCLGVLDDVEFEQRSRENISEYMEELGMEGVLVSEFIENLSGILDVFRGWVSEIDLPVKKRGNFKFGKDAAFVNFNYTETLEAYYGVSRERILYIHGRRGTEGPLIVGHDIDPPEARHKDDLPDIQYNPFYAYLRKTRKPVASIEPELRNWLDNFPNIGRILVRGHSLGTVDLPYFKLVAEAFPKATWSFSYYSGLADIKSCISFLGIDAARVFSVATLSEFERCPNTRGITV